MSGALLAATFTPLAAIGTPLALGNTNAASGSTTLVLTTTAVAPVGSTIFVACVSAGLTVTATDSAGNTYTVTTPTIQGGLSVYSTSLFYAPVTTQLASGGTITLTYSASTSAKAMIAVSVTGLQASPFDSQTIANSAVVDTNPSVTSATWAQAKTIVFAVIGAAAATVTEDAAFTSLGTATNGALVHLGYKIVSSTAAVSYSATLSVASKWGNGIAGFKGN